MKRKNLLKNQRIECNLQQHIKISIYHTYLLSLKICNVNFHTTPFKPSDKVIVLAKFIKKVVLKMN